MRAYHSASVTINRKFIKQKTPEIGAVAHASIINAIPEAIETALLQYQLYMDGQQKFDTSKEFKDHNAAAKAGLAHIELLIKLAKMVDVVNEDRAETIIEQINNAQQELDKDNA